MTVRYGHLYGPKGNLIQARWWRWTAEPLDAEALIRELRL